ncbi:BLUF domain-containing protein [Aliikangiella sp. IMCC44653]
MQKAENVWQLAYISRAVNIQSEDDLVEILNISRKNNLKASISGFLMYGDGCFFQVIEGPRLEIDNLYQTLLTDTRHHSLVLLLNRDIPQRLFDTWSMAFRRFTYLRTREIIGFSEFLEDYLGDNLPKEINPNSASKEQEVVLQIIQQMRKSYLRKPVGVNT